MSDAVDELNRKLEKFTSDQRNKGSAPTSTISKNGLCFYHNHNVKKGDFTGGNNECPTLTSQLYIKCSITNLKFFIDTGSSCSVIPVDPNSRDHPQDYLSLLMEALSLRLVAKILLLTWEVRCL